ncbi:hypothetical protein [Streptomyces sp. bgisy159]|uniref:hypothetical protein n=1 Tax=Streptomyces sp. bgisy159 TaxID=3413795 RepID=UPI003F4A5095
MRRTALAALCVAAATATTLTACQSDKGDTVSTSDKSTGATASATTTPERDPFAGLSGGEIADRALTATKGTSSLRVKGDIPDDETGDVITIDMALNKKGECAGTLSMGGGKTDLIRTGDTVYMKYNEAFLRAQSKGESPDEADSIVTMLAGKWTKTTATGEDAMDLSEFCDLNSLLDDTDEGRPVATRGKTTTVDGTPAVTVTEKDGKDVYTVYVATEGKPYVLRIDSTSAEDPGTISFSDFDKPVQARKPSGDIIDLDS